MSRMRRRLNWSAVSLAAAPVHTLRRPAGSSVWGLGAQKRVDSFTAGSQTRSSKARESSVTRKSGIKDHAVEENHVIDWDKVKVVDREAQRQTRWIKESLWIRKTPICMNWDAGSYQLGHTRDQVISMSRASSSCNRSTRREHDVLTRGG